MKPPDEQLVVLGLGVVFVPPVRLRRELVEIPGLRCREIITLGHPLGFKPEQVAWEPHIPHHGAVSHDIELVFQHIGTETQSICPARKQVRPSGHLGVSIQERGDPVTEHEVEIRLGRCVIDIESTWVNSSCIKILLGSIVVVDRPPAGAEHERMRTLGVLVSRPHAQYLSTMLDMGTASVAAPVKSLPVTQGKGYHSDLGFLPAV